MDSSEASKDPLPTPTGYYYHALCLCQNRLEMLWHKRRLYNETKMVSMLWLIVSCMPELCEHPANNLTNLCMSVHLFFTYPNNCSSDPLQTCQVFCWRPEFQVVWIYFLSSGLQLFSRLPTAMDAA